MIFLLTRLTALRIAAFLDYSSTDIVKEWSVLDLYLPVDERIESSLFMYAP
jgi:hypothetical protein